ncbi:hypothetical protein VNO77_23023 [Canavalia gladiata]|uniref:Uncharacterized protein n=1 Tax=Canavalia gladiata TaxID=3824 RepID=A0AAN9L3Q3_CANGL
MKRYLRYWIGGSLFFLNFENSTPPFLLASSSSERHCGSNFLLRTSRHFTKSHNNLPSSIHYIQVLTSISKPKLELLDKSVESKLDNPSVPRRSLLEDSGRPSSSHCL